MSARVRADSLGIGDRCALDGERVWSVAVVNRKKGIVYVASSTVPGSCLGKTIPGDTLVLPLARP